MNKFFYQKNTQMKKKQINKLSLIEGVYIYIKAKKKVTLGEG